MCFVACPFEANEGPKVVVNGNTGLFIGHYLFMGNKRISCNVENGIDNWMEIGFQTMELQNGMKLGLNWILRSNGIAKWNSNGFH